MNTNVLKAIALTIIFLSLNPLYGQGLSKKPVRDTTWCLDSVEIQQVLKDYAKLEFLESKDSIQQVKDSVREVRDNDRETRIYNLQLELIDKNEQIEMFKHREAKVELLPLVKWDGLHLGVTAAYGFNDAIIIKQTVLEGMEYDLTLNARAVFWGKWTGGLGVGVPLRKEKFYIKGSVEYRLF